MNVLGIWQTIYHSLLDKALGTRYTCVPPDLVDASAGTVVPGLVVFVRKEETIHSLTGTTILITECTYLWSSPHRPLIRCVDRTINKTILLLLLHDIAILVSTSSMS
jgi:hypothetical protein